MNSLQPVSPEHFAKTLRLTSILLLEHYEENGCHHVDEITKLLCLLSDLKYAKQEESGDEVFLLDFRDYMGVP